MATIKQALARDRLLEIDPDHYRKIGHLGGSSKKTKPSGFAAMPRRKVVAAGKKGGKIGGLASGKKKVSV